MSNESDVVRSFVFEGQSVRGAWVRLDKSFQANLLHHDYPKSIQNLLGQAIAASVLLGNSIKLNGLLTLQVQGPGPMNLLVVQLTDRFSYRGLVRLNAAVPNNASTLQDFTGQGTLFVTLDHSLTPPDGNPNRSAARSANEQRYQGVVSLEAGSLTQCLEDYFERSEQLPTKLWLMSDGESVVGLMLQKLPSLAEVDDEGSVTELDLLYEELSTLANTVSQAELLSIDCETLLHRLFHEHTVRLFEPRAVYFQCGCSKERVNGILRSLGKEEVSSIVAEQGGVEIRCEFCNRLYKYDPVDALNVLALESLSGSNQLH